MYEWKVLKTWPKVKLPISPEVLRLCRELFEQYRFRFELHRDTRELRLLCANGYDSGLSDQGAEMYPVDDHTWGAILSGGYWTRKLLNLLGDNAMHPGGAVITNADAGCRFDEIQLQFPKNRLNKVFKLLQPKTRPLRNQHGNPANLCAGEKSRFTASWSVRIAR